MADIMQPRMTEEPGKPTLHLHSLSEDLQEFSREVSHRNTTLGELMQVLKERGHLMIIVVLTLPFMIPVPSTLGLSAPAGLAVAVLGFYILIGAKPILPGFIRRRELSPATMQRLVGFLLRMAKRLEKVLQPRFRFMLWPGMVNLVGVGLILSGLFLALPLPIPGTNVLPAAVILLLALGMMERDGVFVIVGHSLVITGIILTIIFWNWATEFTMKVIGQVLAWMGWG